MNSIRIDNLEARSGERKSGYLFVGETSTGSVHIPVTIINGTRPGPTLCISGGVHGFEYSSIVAVMRMIRETDPSALSGTLIAVPIVNVPAFETRGPQGGNSTAFQCPIDGINLNRIMPGNPDGSMGYQIADVFMKKVVAKAEYLIDCHGGDLNEELVPFVITAAGNQGPNRVAKEILATSFGTQFVIEEEDLVGMTNTSALALGKPAIIIEAGGYGRVLDEAVDLIISGVRNAMKRLKMLDGQPTSTKQIVRKGWWSVYAKRGGVCFSAALGSKVNKGQEIAEVDNLLGERLESIQSPVDGTIIFKRTPIPVSTNDRIFGIVSDEDIAPPKARPYP